jgi:hypothetical protein
MDHDLQVVDFLDSGYRIKPGTGFAGMTYFRALQESLRIPDSYIY